MTVNRADRRPSSPPPAPEPAANQAGGPGTAQKAAPTAPTAPAAPAAPPQAAPKPAPPSDGFAAGGDRRFSTSSSAPPAAPPAMPPAQAAAMRTQAASAELSGFRATSGPSGASNTTATSSTSGTSATSATSATGPGSPITTLGNAAAAAKLRNAGLSPADTQKALKEFDQLPASYQAKLLGDSKVSPQDLGKMLVAGSDMRAFAADPKNAARMAGVPPWPGARNIDTKEKFSQVLSEEGLSPQVKTEFMNKTLEKLKADPSLNASKAMMDVVNADPAKFRGQGPKIDPVEIEKQGGLGRAFGLKNLVDKNLTDPAKDFFRQYALASGLKPDASVTDAKKQGEALALSGMQLALKNANGDLGKVLQQSGLTQDKFFKGTLSGYNETPAWTYPANQLPTDPSKITPDVLKNKLALGDDVFKGGAVVINIPPDKAKTMNLTKPTALDGIALPEWAPTDPKNAWGMTKPLDPGKNPPCPEGMLKPVDLGSSIDLTKTRVVFQ